MCDHPPNAGRSGSHGACLICATERALRGWRYPAATRHQRVAHGRQTNERQSNDRPTKPPEPARS